MDDAADVKPGRIRIDDKAGNAVAALARIRTRENDAVFRLVCAGDENLRAVDDPVIAILDRPGLYGARRIGAAGRFGQSEKAVFLAVQRRIEITLFQILARLVKVGEPGAAEASVAGRI